MIATNPEATGIRDIDVNASLVPLRAFLPQGWCRESGSDAKALRIARRRKSKMDNVRRNRQQLRELKERTRAWNWFYASDWSG